MTVCGIETSTQHRGHRAQHVHLHMHMRRWSGTEAASK